MPWPTPVPMRLTTLFQAVCLVATISQSTAAQALERELLALGSAKLAAAARAQGDAKRGAVVFFQKRLNCTRCHVPDAKVHRLGPDLTELASDTTDVYLVESILTPSRVIRKGFEHMVLETEEGTVTGMLARETATELVILDAARDYKEARFKKSKLEEFFRDSASSMPSGLVNPLTSQQQFLDLVRYLIEIRDGGKTRADELEPDPSLYAERPLPAYENDIDHAGMIRAWNEDAFKRGKKLYGLSCSNCHGTRGEPGSLPTSLKFWSGEFKNGNDPYVMYRTLTHGFGMMTAQTWMVPSQKYDVIHYVREAFLKPYNPAQVFAVSDGYLANLPKGKSRGPAPSRTSPWQRMDYGPNQCLTLEIGDDAKNFAYKGNAIRLDAGPGGVAEGGYWMAYDYDTLRVAAAWTGKGFVDWNCIHFNGKHNVHPRLVGELRLANPTGPGWGRPADGSFRDTRLVGRDGRLYGPLPRKWAQYKGMYYHGPDTLVEYTVGATRVLEMPEVQIVEPQPVFRRVFNAGPRKTDLVLQVAHSDAAAKLTVKGGVAVFGSAPPKPDALLVGDASRLNGGTRLDVTNTVGLNVGAGDFTLTARIKTRHDGTILAQTTSSLVWPHDGLTWFIRNGKLTVDIGWVGAFSGNRRVADGKWHDLAFCYAAKTGTIRFYIDGKPEQRTGKLRRKAPLKKPIVRIGCTAENFPRRSFFDGTIKEVRFFNSVLGDDEIKHLDGQRPAAHWELGSVVASGVSDKTGNGHAATVFEGKRAAAPSRVVGFTVAGFAGDVAGFEWRADKGDLRLKIPAGAEPRAFTVWFAAVKEEKLAATVADAVVIDDPDQDLTVKTKGGPARWPHVLTTRAMLGNSDEPFAIDVLKRPTDNPWFCRMRLTGFDFTGDGDSLIASAWDGSIWKVSGLAALDGKTTKQFVSLTWRRIASGLFQPLGVKIVNGRTYVTCRDQLCVLHDLNGDEEIDWFECFNNDHQVTEHFHEFAMGLQADAEGNFYYAKSARHAKTAIVPHHGTLLRISKDGQRTDIIANGFRAANGVCLNPDGTFIVTDQEGHWNPKNRINYVKPGGFYGNMYGYHDVTDASDSAMQQPLVWITNSFDRSPGELLWVDSPKWGPLNKRLLNLSYGYGMVYIVPHETVNGQEQGGVCAFPIERFPTGVMRGRFHPQDGQLYLAGMFAWSGSQTQPGGLYRLRYTGKPVHLPVELGATKRGVSVTFSGKLDPKSATSTASYKVKVWDLKRTKNYGSKHFNERTLPVAAARIDADGRTVHLEIPKVGPTWGMEIKYEVRSVAGKWIKGKIHNTIYHLQD